MKKGSWKGCEAGGRWKVRGADHWRQAGKYGGQGEEDFKLFFEEMSWSRLALPYGYVPRWSSRLMMDTLHPAIKDPMRFPLGRHFYLGDSAFGSETAICLFICKYLPSDSITRSFFFFPQDSSVKKNSSRLCENPKI